MENKDQLKKEFDEKFVETKTTSKDVDINGKHWVVCEKRPSPLAEDLWNWFSQHLDSLEKQHEEVVKRLNTEHSEEVEKAKVEGARGFVNWLSNGRESFIYRLVVHMEIIWEKLLASQSASSEITKPASSGESEGK